MMENATRKHVSRNARLRKHAEQACVVLAGCDQCGRRAPQLHLCGERAYCPRCCPGCAWTSDRIGRDYSAG
jgi:hypothetical protein